MPDYSELLQALKRAAVEAVEVGKPAAFCYGTVTGVEPLQIMADQKLPLGEKQLELTRAVQDYNVDIEISTNTEDKSGGGGYAEFAAHKHEIKGRKAIHVHNDLQVGEKVLMLRVQHGQRFIVLSRLIKRT